MSSNDLAAFMAYVTERGIPDKYHQTYEREASSILRELDRSALWELDDEALHDAVRRIEQALQNRRAVVAAINAYIRAASSGWAPGEGSLEEHHVDSIRAMGSPAIATSRPGEHRRFVRVPFNGSVQVSGAVGGQNRASDISIGGLYLESRQSWEMGEVLELEFRLHPKEPALKVKGRVVFVDHGMGAGIDFIDPPRAARHSIRRFVEESVSRER